MSYFNINIDAIDNMIAEYKTLRETLKNCGDVLSTAVVNLSCDVHMGADANCLRDNWTIQHRDTIPTIAELLDGIITILEDSSNEYKECKSYCSNMINVFNDYKTVQYSADSMNGYALCDVDSIETAIEYENEIGEDACKNADDIANALEVVAGLNYGQSGLQSALKDLADENVKLTDYSVHAYQLRQYIQKMVEADDHLYDKLVGINIPFIGYFDDSFVPSGLVLANCSPEVIQAARILAKGNPTKAEEKFLCSVFSEYSFDENDMMLLINVIGNEEWDSYDILFMSGIYKYGVEHESVTILSAVFNNMLSSDDSLSMRLLDSDKALQIMNLIDPDTNPKAYDSMSRFMKIPFQFSDVTSKEVSIYSINNELYFNYNVHWLTTNGVEQSFSEDLSFVCIDEIITVEGKNNLFSMGFTDADYCRYRTSFYSDEDIIFLKNLSETDINDQDSLTYFFSQDVKGVTSYTIQALTEYTLHFGQYGSEEYNEKMCSFLNAMYSGGAHTFYELDIKDVVDNGGMLRSNVDFYLDELVVGYEAKFDEQLYTTMQDFTKENYEEYKKMDTLETFFISQVAMYNDCISPHYAPNSNGSDLYIINISMSKVTTEVMEYDFRYQLNIPEYPQYGYCNNITIDIYFDTNGMISSNGIQSNDISSYHWQKDHFYQEVIYETAKLGAYIYNPYSASIIGVGELIVDSNKSIPAGVLGKDAVTVVKAENAALSIIKDYQAIEKGIAQTELDFMADRVGMHSGFSLSSNDYVAVDIADFGQYNNKYYNALEKPISPEGYLFLKEVENGFYVEQLNASEKKELENSIKDKFDGEMEKEVMEYLFGGFDYFEYMESHTSKEFSDLVTNAGLAYTDAFSSDEDYSHLNRDLNLMATEWQRNKVSELYQ